MLSLPLTLCLLGFPGASPSPQEGPPPPPPAATLEPASDADWARRVERDRRISFTPRTAELARRDLERLDLSEADRAVALYAVGAGKAVREVVRLEEAALLGAPLERRAAILGLGELGVGVEALLGEELASEELGGSAVLALLLTRRATDRQRARELARRLGPELEAKASELELLLVSPERSSPSTAGRAWLDLRWSAAKAYGLVDGQSWPMTLTLRLVHSESFLDEVVYRAAASLPRPGIGDHLLAPVLAGDSPAALRAAARAMPAELDRILEHRLWQPAEGDWIVLLEELEEMGAPAPAARLLARIAERDELRLRALAALARAGESAQLEGLGSAWEHYSQAERELVCEAWGSSGSRDALAWLRGREAESPARVEAAVWIARARLGDLGARDRVQTVLGDPFASGRSAWVSVATKLAWDRSVATWLDAALPVCTPKEQLEVSIALCLAGRLGPLPILRDALRQGVPEGELGARLLRAIAERGTAEDRQRLAHSFPIEHDDEAPEAINALLVRLVLADRNLRVMPVLRAALWREPFDRSLLAGALMAELGSGYLLREEIVRWPAGASERDFRRVGFAAGVWGGMAALDALAAHPRIQPGAPVLEGALLGALASRTR